MRNETVKIEAGTLAGKCENCGLVHGNELKTNFPHGSTCQRCGEEVEKTKAVSETTEVPADV